MSLFRPGNRNRSLIVRPMQEACLASRDGGQASLKLLRFFKKNQLEKDATYFMPKNPPLICKWHEPKYSRWRRRKRERMTKHWNEEIRNTSEYALWWRYRVQAPEGSYGNIIYKRWLENEKLQKEKEYHQAHIKNEYKSWNIDALQIPIRRKIRQRTKEEKEYQDSLQPESKLKELKDNFRNKVGANERSFDEWKHDTLHLTNNTKNKSKSESASSFDIGVDSLIDPNKNLTSNEKIMLLENSNMRMINNRETLREISNFLSLGENENENEIKTKTKISGSKLNEKSILNRMNFKRDNHDYDDDEYMDEFESDRITESRVGVRVN